MRKTKCSSLDDATTDLDDCLFSLALLRVPSRSGTDEDVITVANTLSPYTSCNAFGPQIDVFTFLSPFAVFCYTIYTTWAFVGFA